jgi:hypothetical protein
MNEHEQTRKAEEVRDKQHAVLLVCFEGRQAAARARRSLDAQVRSTGDSILDTVVLQVNAKHKASVYDPRRILAGTLTAALTWGLFGLVSGGFQSLVISAVFGALCGGLYAYLHEHILTKDDLTRIGMRFQRSRRPSFSSPRRASHSTSWRQPLAIHH